MDELNAKEKSGNLFPPGIVTFRQQSFQLSLSISMSTASLQARLAPLFDSLKQTQNLINRLSKLPSTLGSAPSNPDEGDTRIELSSEIHQTLKEQEEDFELIWQEAEDLSTISSWARRRDSGRDSNKEKERNDLASQVAKLGEDLKMYVPLWPCRITSACCDTDRCIVIEPELSSAKRNSKPNATSKPPNVKSVNSYLPGSKKAPPTNPTQVGTVAVKVKRRKHKKSFSLVPRKT